MKPFRCTECYRELKRPIFYHDKPFGKRCLKIKHPSIKKYGKIPVVDDKQRNIDEFYYENLQEFY